MRSKGGEEKQVWGWRFTKKRVGRDIGLQRINEDCGSGGNVVGHVMKDRGLASGVEQVGIRLSV